MLPLLRLVVACLALAAPALAALPARAFETQATAAWVFDVTTHTVLMDKNADEPVPPASMSKLMTINMLFEALRDGRVAMDTTFAVSSRAKGMGERTVVLKHVLRNSLIPVVTVIALGMPTIFGGAIITEQVFKVNGLGAALIGAIHANDLPMVQTLTFIFAILIVIFNLIADILYGILDPRIRYA